MKTHTVEISDVKFPSGLKKRFVEDIANVLIEKGQPGTFLSYEDLSEAFQIPIRQMPYSMILLEARHLVRDNNKIIWEPQKGKGIICINDEQKLKLVYNVKQQMRKKSQKGIAILNTIEYEKLSNSDKLKFNRDMSILGVLHTIASPVVSDKVTISFERKMDYTETLKVLNLIDEREVR